MNSIEELIAYAEGEITGPRAAEIEARLAGDPAAAALVARYRQARAAMRAEDGAEPPPAAVARVKAIYDPARFVSGRSGSLQRLGELFVRLLYDSRAEPAPVGLRGGTAFQLTYELGEGAAAPIELELQLEPLDDGRAWRLIGQVSSEEPLGGLRVTLHRPGADEPAREAAPDERGVFILTVEAGSYDLRVHTAQGTAVVPDLRIP